MENQTDHLKLHSKLDKKITMLDSDSEEEGQYKMIEQELKENSNNYNDKVYNNEYAEDEKGKFLFTFSPIISDIASSLDDLPLEEQTKILFWDFDPKKQKLRYDQKLLKSSRKKVGSLRDSVFYLNNLAM